MGVVFSQYGIGLSSSLAPGHPDPPAADPRRHPLAGAVWAGAPGPGAARPGLGRVIAGGGIWAGHRGAGDVAAGAGGVPGRARGVRRPPGVSPRRSPAVTRAAPARSAPVGWPRPSAT